MSGNIARKCVAEFVGTFTLIFVGIAAIYNASNAASGLGLVGVALAHGLAIAVMVSATGGISGGHLNPAVTFGVFVGGKISAADTFAYWISQLAGAYAAAVLLVQIGGDSGIEIVRNGTPVLASTIGVGQGIAIEAVLTFFLVFVVYGSAVDVRAPKIGGLAIGATIAMDIMAGGPLTGGAMNPARTFGPALAGGQWSHHIVYWVGPLLGGALAGLIYGRFLIKTDKPA
jgi:MIP family channel proteins